LGDFPNKPGGFASIDVDGNRYIFQNSQYTLTHTEWAYDAVHQVYYPIQSVFQADNGTAQIALTMNVLETDPLAVPLPPGVPNEVVYEQTANFTGRHVL
jgi:hypothetical protein